MDIYLIRHTEVAVGRSVAYGQTDVELAETYHGQRDRLQMHLPANPAAIFSSPLTRCRRLAEDLALALAGGNMVQCDDRLKEYHFGDWEMKPWNDIDRVLLDAWMADFVNVPTPNGENFQDVFNRVYQFLGERILPLADTLNGGPVLVVAHGGVIRALLCLFLSLPLQAAYRINLDYGAVTKVTLLGSTPTIQYINR